MIIKVDGLKALEAKLAKMPSGAEGAVLKSLKLCTADLKGKSQRLAPVEFGDLRGSAYSSAGIEGGKVVGEVGFTVPYATRQHEELKYKHPKGGQAKYLETPLKANIDKYIKDIGETIEKAVDR